MVSSQLNTIDRQALWSIAHQGRPTFLLKMADVGAMAAGGAPLRSVDPPPGYSPMGTPSIPTMSLT